MEASRGADFYGILQERTGLGSENWVIKADSFYTKTALANDKAQEIINSLKENGIKAKLTHGLEKGTSFVRISSKQLSKANNAPPVATPKAPSQKVRDDLQEMFEDLAIDREEEVEKKIRKGGGYDKTIPGRYRDIPCPVWTELKYRTIVESQDEDGVTTVEEKEYPFKIHANRVELEGMPFILSQAPLPESQTAFWKAVCENSTVILDLTNQTDRTQKKVQRYFPHEVEEEWTSEDNKVSVTCLDETLDVADLKKLKKHDYELKAIMRYPNETHDGNDEVIKDKIVSRLHFRGWPDRGAVSVNELKTIVEYLRANEQMLEGLPLWIHCNAGVGRSGTVAVAIALSKMNDEGKLRADNYPKIIDDLIIQGRTQRGPVFVQSSSQYQLLHDFAKFLIGQ